MHSDDRSFYALLRSDPEHSSLLDIFSDAVIFLDAMGAILAANKQAEALIGIDKDELRGQILWQAAPHLVTASFYRSVIHATRTRTSLQIEHYLPANQAKFQVYLTPTRDGIVLFLHAVTEQAAFQDPAHHLDGRYLSLLEEISEWLAILTPDGLLLEINQQPLLDAQVQQEKVVGKPFIQFPTLSTDPAVQEQLTAAIMRSSRGETAYVEMKLQLPSGKQPDMILTLTPHYAEDQQIEYLICTGRDISARKQMEEELRTLIDTIPQFIWMAEADGRIVYNNQSMAAYQVMTTEEIQGDGWMACLHPDERQYVQETWRHSIRTGTPYEIEHRMRDGNSGEYRWFLVRGAPQRDEQGTITAWIGTATDINEKKQAEERIKASEENFRVLAETVPHLVWTIFPDGRYEYVNQRYRDITQANFDISGDALWRQFIHPDDLAHTMELRYRSLETGEGYENEYRLKDGRTGEYSWFLGRAYPLRDNAGNIVKWFGTSTDINQQKLTEEALLQSQRQVKALMASNVIGIILIEEETIIEANDMFLRMTGYSREDLQRGELNWVHMTPPEYMDITGEAHEQLAQSEYMTPFEKEYICKDGYHLAILLGGVTIQHNPIQTVCFVLDNSARKELEQRKDAFISMAGHELKTPLTALKMRTQLLRQRLERQGQSQIVESFTRVEEPIRRLERLIGELLDVSKMQAGKLEFILESIDLSALVREVAETMQQIETSHTITVDATQPLLMEGDQGRLEQVLINLLTNAIKYSPKGETVEVTVSSTSETATIRVRDHGAGIPQEQREKIFERFYRIDDPKRGKISGLGMGLYVVKEIVKQHQGTILVESELGKGSTFSIILPLKQKAEVQI